MAKKRKQSAKPAKAGLELVRCPRTSHLVSPDDLGFKKDGSRSKLCNKHLIEMRKKNAEKKQNRPSGTIQEKEGPNKGKICCSHDHWALAENFDPGYKTCRNCLERQRSKRARKREKGPNRGEIWCSGHAKYITLEAFGPLNKDDEEPYKVCSSCRERTRVHHAQQKADRIQQVANLTLEQLPLYCMTCYNFKESPDDLTVSVKTRNGERVEYNQCHGCNEKRLQINLTNQLNCLRGECGAQFESQEERNIHFEHECKWKLCAHCKASILKEEMPAHAKVCLFKKCPTCAGKIALEEFDDHKVACQRRLHARQAELDAKGKCAYLHGLGSLPCHSAPMAGSSYCREHNIPVHGGDLNTVAEKKLLSGLILGPEGQRAIKKLKMTKAAKEIFWFSEVMASRPQEVICGDTEFAGHQLSSPHPTTCQVKLSNGKSEDIVPNTTVKYPDTKSQQFEHWNCAQSFVAMSVFKKFYGVADDGPTVGIDGAESIDWKGIGTKIRDYWTTHGLQAEDCVFVEWSGSGHVDYDNIKAGLESVEKDTPDTLEKNSPLPRLLVNPLIYWRRFRDGLKLKRNRKGKGLFFGLNLGNLYSILYPEDKNTLETQHTAGTDVKMLIAVTKFFLRMWNDDKEPHRIDSYWKPKAKVVRKEMESEDEEIESEDEEIELEDEEMESEDEEMESEDEEMESEDDMEVGDEMNLEEEMETLIDIRLELEDKAKVADESSDDENDEEEEEEDDDDDEEDSEPIARPAKRWRRN